MKVFHELVYDDYVSDVDPTYSDPAFDARLGAAERLALVVVADEVSGTAPAVTLGLEHSGDGENWVAKGGGAAVKAVALVAGQASAQCVGGGDYGGAPALGFVRLKLAMASGSAARLRVWVTGRSETNSNEA